MNNGYKSSDPSHYNSYDLERAGVNSSDDEISASAKIRRQQEKDYKSSSSFEQDSINRIPSYSSHFSTTKKEVIKKALTKDEKQFRINLLLVLFITITFLFIIYKTVSPFHNFINNATYRTPESLERGRVTSLLVGEHYNGNKYTFRLNHKSKVDKLITNLAPDIMSKAQVNEIVVFCLANKDSCDIGIPYNLLVDISIKNNTLEKLENKINKLLMVETNSSLMPNYQFKKYKFGYILDKTN